MNTLNTTIPRLPVRVQVAVAHYIGFRIEVYRVPSGRYTTKRQCVVEPWVELGSTLTTQEQALDQTRRMIDLDAGRRQQFEDAGLDRLLADVSAAPVLADPIEQRAREDAEGAAMGGDRFE